MTHQLCQKCKKFYKLNISLPDFLWEQVTGTNNYEYLCGKCIIEKLEEIAMEDMEKLYNYDHWFLVVDSVANYWLSNPPEEVK